MTDQGRRHTFPLRVSAADNPGDVIAVLEANGTWSGDADKLVAALGRMEDGKGAIEPLVMWLLLREMQRESADT